MTSSTISDPASLIKTAGTDLNQHTCTVGWADTPLMSLYQHGLKENIQHTMVMSNVNFDSLRSMQVMALKTCQTIEGIQQGHKDPNRPQYQYQHPPPPTLM
ncbi:uncharacterized protein VP01_1609g7 [Puccinia sorghi]|uniref:Uncharacterized protein n=1 Tax=Puccinia sorghi TaxID=27349 RepID=A0A0L6VH79_9BASI|nr:uncharacterized protein VP01_1609g7 [Puccinia sorghi]